MNSRTDRLPGWNMYYLLADTSHDGICLTGWCNLWNMDGYYLSFDHRASKEVFAVTIRAELEQFSDLADFFASQGERQQ